MRSSIGVAFASLLLMGCFDFDGLGHLYDGGGDLSDLGSSDLGPPALFHSDFEDTAFTSARPPDMAPFVMPPMAYGFVADGRYLSTGSSLSGDETHVHGGRRAAMVSLPDWTATPPNAYLLWLEPATAPTTQSVRGYVYVPAGTKDLRFFSLHTRTFDSIGNAARFGVDPNGNVTWNTVKPSDSATKTVPWPYDRWVCLSVTASNFSLDAMGRTATFSFRMTSPGGGSVPPIDEAFVTSTPVYAASELMDIVVGAEAVGVTKGARTVWIDDVDYANVPLDCP